MSNKLIPTSYSQSKAYLAAVNQAKEVMTSNRFNVFQNTPIICKAQGCKFYSTCILKDSNMKELIGTRCPFELAMAAQLSDKYIKHFIPDYTEEEHDPIILDLIRELVDYEIQINRAERIMADKGSFLDDFIMGVSISGEIISNKDVAKWVSYKNTLVEKKHKTLQLLNSTPKDQAANVTATTDFASYLKDIKSRYQEEYAIENAIEAPYKEKEEE